MARQPTAAKLSEVGVGKVEALAYPKDLRAFLQKLVEYDSKQLMVVDKEIDPIFEAPAIVDNMRNDGRYPNYPAVLFRKVKGSNIPLLINLHGTYERLALSIDSDVKNMAEEFHRRESNPIPVKHVSRSEAPVKQVVWTGADADLSKLPLLRHQELDAGKYITSAVSITRDPKSGVQNAGIFRAQVHNNHELGFMCGVYQSTGYILWEHRERKQRMQVALCIGHHPAMLLSGTTNPPGLGGELEIAGGLLQQPFELVKASISMFRPGQKSLSKENWILILRPTARKDPSASILGITRAPVLRPS
jgi:2,5-furandicarboxylate decarboxylase 1